MGKKSIKIKYIKSYDYKTVLTTGIYGGLANSGLINANFFTDRTIIPKSQTIEINDAGEPIGIPIEEKDGDMTREVQIGLLMDANTAKAVVSWLQAKIDEFEKYSNG